MQGSGAGLRLAALVISVSTATQAIGAPHLQGAGPARTTRETADVVLGLAAARKLCADRRWGNALSAFEDLARSAPDDAGLHSELGWAAFQAGDHAKARNALERSVALAKRPVTKAESLYSLGRVEEAAGRRDLAARRYRESLALRGSGVVEQRLRSLEDEKAGSLLLAEPNGKRSCAEPMTLADVCACVLPHLDTAPWKAETKCRVLDEPSVVGFRLLEAKTNAEEALFLLEAREAGWRVLAKLGTVVLGRSTLQNTTVEDTDVAGTRVLRWTTHLWEHHLAPGTQEGYDEERNIVTVCVGTPPLTRCPLVIPLLDVYAPYGPGEGDEAATRLRIDIGNDGIAYVVLEAGVAPEEQGLLGPHRLW